MLPHPTLLTADQPKASHSSKMALRRNMRRSTIQQRRSQRELILVKVQMLHMSLGTSSTNSVYRFRAVLLTFSLQDIECILPRLSEKLAVQHDLSRKRSMLQC